MGSICGNNEDFLKLLGGMPMMTLLVLYCCDVTALSGIL
jgi:hypothetical protein